MKHVLKSIRALDDVNLPPGGHEIDARQPDRIRRNSV
jgi:hypothetical protein